MRVSKEHTLQTLKDLGFDVDHLLRTSDPVYFIRKPGDRQPRFWVDPVPKFKPAPIAEHHITSAQHSLIPGFWNHQGRNGIG